MLAECISIENPKNGEVLETRFTQKEAIEIIRGQENNSFLFSLVKQYDADGLSPTQWFYVYKNAHKFNTNTNKVEKPIKLECNLHEWLLQTEIPRVMWKLEDQPRVVLYISKERVNIRFSGGDQARIVGYIKGDELFPSDKCPGKVKQQIIALSLIKLEFLKQCGKLWGRCCICGRELENEESIRRGIGPICEGRMG